MKSSWLFLSLIPLLMTSHAYGQLESITIDGPKKVLYNSIFTFHVDVEGVSRASYGDFSVNLAIVQKDSGRVVTEQPGFLLPGKNSFTWSGKEYGTGKNLVTLEPNIPHIFRIQYLLDTWEFEFLPVATVEDLSDSEEKTGESEEMITINETESSKNEETDEIIVDALKAQIKQLQGENAELKEQIAKKDAVLLEQLKVISNLASMMKKTIFEPIFNYFSFF